MGTIPTDIPKFINALVSDLQSDAWGRGVKLVVDASTAAWTPCAESLLAPCLSRVIATLIGHAPAGTTVSVVTSRADAVPGAETLIIDIVAPGTALLDAHESATAAAVAAQLGIAYSAAVRHETATYTFSLPVMPTAQATHVAGRPTVLVVDDDTDMQDYLDVVLRHHGYNVVAVNDGFAALFVIERDKPAVVITDVMMPNMDGLSLVSRIKEHFADLPVIVYSGYGDALSEYSAVINQADAFLVKPLPRETLLATLAQATAAAPH
jgi:CheY-like chemotaxis protein